MESFFFQILLLTKEGSPYFRILNNKYEEDDYEEFKLLITYNDMCEIPRIIPKVLDSEFIIS
jgi:hypothetical protein